MMGLVINNAKAVECSYAVEITGNFNGTQFKVRTEIGRDRQIYYGDGFVYKVNDEILNADRFSNTFFSRNESYLLFEDELIEKIYHCLESNEMKQRFPTFDDVESLMFENDLKFVQTKSLHADKMTLYARIFCDKKGCYERYIDAAKKGGVNQNRTIIETIEKFANGAFFSEIMEQEAAQFCSENGYQLIAGEEVDYRNYWGLYTFACPDKVELVSQFETLQEVVSFVTRHPVGTEPLSF